MSDWFDDIADGLRSGLTYLPAICVGFVLGALFVLVVIL